MNERIRELYIELYARSRWTADHGVDGNNDPTGWMILYNKKIVELVVLKCAEIADISPYNSADLMKQYFGVE